MKEEKCQPVNNDDDRNAKIKVSMVNIIINEGNIGCGKTTCANNLKEQLKKKQLEVFCFLENFPESELTVLYKDPKNVTYNFQLYVQGYRASQIEDIKRLFARFEYDSKAQPVVVVLDRTFMGDMVFSTVNHESENMTDEQMKAWASTARVKNYGDAAKGLVELIEEFKGCLSPLLFTEIHVVHLDDKPAECKYRVDKDRQSAEKATPIHYYKKIHNGHKMLFTYLEEALPRLIAKQPELSSQLFVHSMKPSIYFNASCFWGKLKAISSIQKVVKDNPQLRTSLETIYPFSDYGEASSSLIDVLSQAICVS